MNAGILAKNVLSYTEYMPSVDMSSYRGSYIMTGSMSDERLEVLEVGEATDSGYRPFIKINMIPEPTLDDTETSYLDTMPGISGSMFGITIDQCQSIVKLAGARRGA